MTSLLTCYVLRIPLKEGLDYRSPLRCVSSRKFLNLQLSQGLVSMTLSHVVWLSYLHHSSVAPPPVACSAG